MTKTLRREKNMRVVKNSTRSPHPRAAAGRTASIPPLDAAAQCSPVRPASSYRKYRNQPVVVDGVRFDSKAEAKRHQELVLLERAGEIMGLTRQPRYPLTVNGEKIGTYVGDWQYIERDGYTHKVCEDKKGCRTPLFKLKAKLFRALYPHIELRLT